MIKFSLFKKKLLIMGIMMIFVSNMFYSVGNAKKILKTKLDLNNALCIFNLKKRI